MIRCTLLILLVSVLGSSLACGFIGGSGEGPVRMVPDDVLELVVVDVAEAALSRTDLPVDLESEISNLENFGDVRRQASLSLPTGHAMIASGDFDFEDIRNSLREQGYVSASYRKYSFLESPDGRYAAALLEEDGFYLSGDFEAVAAVLRDNSRGEGLLRDDDEGELRQAMDLAGEGLVITAMGICQLENNVGCRAVAWAFSRGEDRRTVIEGSAVLLFRDASAAADAAAPVERTLGANQLIHLTKITTDDTVIRLRVDVNRDDFALLEFPILLGGR
jgi:hypothetical protein